MSYVQVSSCTVRPTCALRQKEIVEERNSRIEKIIQSYIETTSTGVFAKETRPVTREEAEDLARGTDEMMFAKRYGIETEKSCNELIILASLAENVFVTNDVAYIFR